MIYFIPAWYYKNQWREREEVWYNPGTSAEADDTVKEIQLFYRRGLYPLRLLILSFAPNFRHFLHRQGLIHVDYWSVFDAMQCVRRKQVNSFSYYDLAWPQGTEFHISPFSVSASLHGERIAVVHFGEGGNMIRIHSYQKDCLVSENSYDDRGFIASIRYFDHGQVIREDYLDDQGNLRFMVFSDGRVEINPNFPFYEIPDGKNWTQIPYSSLQYPDLQTAIREVFLSYLDQLDSESVFCIANHDLHAGLLQEVLAGRKTIVTVFEDRKCFGRSQDALNLMRKADRIVTDSQENEEEVRQVLSEMEAFDSKNSDISTADLNTENRITSITPFSVNHEDSYCLTLPVKNLLLPVDLLSEDEFFQAILFLASYLKDHSKVRVHLFTRSTDYLIEGKILNQVEEILQGASYPLSWCYEDSSSAENAIDQNKGGQRFFVDVCRDSMSIHRCMQKMRILADLSRRPDQFLQVSAVSLGIPQVCKEETRFLENRKNGLILRKTEDLPQALSYYLDSLPHWNEARVEAYRLGDQYSMDHIQKSWKEVISHLV
jgi:accessory secretory protein Asp1